MHADVKKGATRPQRSRAELRASRAPGEAPERRDRSKLGTAAMAQGTGPFSDPPLKVTNF